MQEIVSDGITVIDLVPGAVLQATVISGGGYAVMSLQTKEGSVSFTGASTANTGVATAGPFTSPVSIQVEVKGRISLVTFTPNAVRQDPLTGALVGNEGALLNTGSYGLSSVAYDGSNRVSSFVLNGVTYALTGWGGATVTITGSDGSVRQVKFDGSGRIIGVQ